MGNEVEKANILFKLIRKDNWNNCYDRLEHFKRFPDLREIVSELSNIGWIIVHKKPKFIGIALNTQFKKEIMDFIEMWMPHLKDRIE